MTSRERMRAARHRLLGLVVVRAVVWTVLGALVCVAAMLALDVLLGLPLGVRTQLVIAPALVGLGVMGFHLVGPVRATLAASEEAIALWFERRIPSLRYALVTELALGGAAPPAMSAAVQAAPLERLVAGTARASLGRPALAVSLLLLLILLMPDGAVGRVVRPTAGDALARPLIGADATNALATIVVRVQPPAYSGLASAAYDDPAAVAALVGSRVTIEGRGQGVAAWRDGVEDEAVSSQGRWRIALPVPARAEAVRLRAGTRERVLVLEPITDSVPQVELVQPARDTVLREARGTLSLQATLRDDLGLADAAFELILSAGAGELYTFRTLSIAARRFDAAARTGSIDGQVSLDSLGLKPGDFVHLRAVARDRNDVTGAGRGASETRTIRIARADEYDSVAVDPAPPSEPEKDALSQRMILMQTQELVARRPRPTETVRTRDARRIAVDQTKLRKKVGEVVFLRLGEDASGEHEHFAGDGHQHAPEGTVNPDAILAAAERAANADPTRNLDNHGDETPIVAINRPLLEAYNHMWRASEELETGRPEAAIPWMERAIAALQRARAAERIYLRGRPPRVVIDLQRVRLAGKDEGRPQARTPRASPDPARAERLRRFDRALDLVVADAGAAADSLLLIRVALPVEERGAALALDAAAARLRQGGDVTAALVAARRLLVQDPPRRAPLTAWGQ